MGNAFDFSPLFRSTVGFDRFMSLLESAARVDEATLSYPPCNIERSGEDAYRVSLAVAGFGKDDLQVETRENSLIVTGKQEAAQGEHRYLHQGIAGRPFKRSFQLADHMKVTGVWLENGLLNIDIVREVPEEMKPRRIEIASSLPQSMATKAKKLISGGKAAA